MAEMPRPTRASLKRHLGLNRSTAALLAAILLIGMGQELWAPFMPKFIQEGIERRLQGQLQAWGLSPQVIIVLAVGLFGTLKDLQEGLYYYFGGRLGGTLGTRRALLAFATLPLVGYALILATPAAYAALAAFVALPFIGAYDSISQPATLTVVGDTLKSRYRTMAFSLQSIQRRVPRVIAYLAGGALVGWLGAIGGIRVAVVLSAALVGLAVLVQFFLLRTDRRDQARDAPGLSLALLRRFPPALRRLLMADILARIAEGLPRELFILYAVAAPGALSLGHLSVSPAQFGQLLALQALVSLLIYIPIGVLAARPGAGKKPFIATTFICFACFPLAFWGLGRLWGLWGLAGAYVIAGLREIGEPARKAMITELLPPDARTAATGVYWAVRSFAVMLAPILGALLWIGIGPAAVFVGAFAAGILGAIWFAVAFRAG